jgi:hypothetical protein
MAGWSLSTVPRLVLVPGVSGVRRWCMLEKVLGEMTLARFRPRVSLLRLRTIFSCSFIVNGFDQSLVRYRRTPYIVSESHDRDLLSRVCLSRIAVIDLINILNKSFECLRGEYGLILLPTP